MLNFNWNPTEYFLQAKLTIYAVIESSKSQDFFLVEFITKQKSLAFSTQIIAKVVENFGFIHFHGLPTFRAPTIYTQSGARFPERKPPKYYEADISISGVSL